MKKVTADTRLADLIQSNNELLPVLTRFNIRLGFGDSTLSDICRRYSIDIKLFLLVINLYLDKEYFPEKELRAVSLKSILSYLASTHSYYLDHALPGIDRLFEKLTSECRGNCSSLNIIRQFYNQYKGELLYHIQDEEDTVFPYIRRLISETEMGSVPDAGFRITSFEKEHSNVEEKIADLKSILIKHFEASYNPNTCNEFLYALSQFEKDITDHARIEDKVLVPLVKDIENRLYPGRVSPAETHTPASRNDEMNTGIDESLPGGLSKREAEVLKLVALGLSNKEIANRLFISSHTVISHRKKITSKLGIKSISGLTVYAIINNLIDTDQIDSETLV